MRKPMRILHVIGVMDRGGAETMIMNLYRNIDRSKVQFDFVQNEGSEAAYDKEIIDLTDEDYQDFRDAEDDDAAFDEEFLKSFMEEEE